MSAVFPSRITSPLTLDTKAEPVGGVADLAGGDDRRDGAAPIGVLAESPEPRMHPVLPRGQIVERGVPEDAAQRSGRVDPVQRPADDHGEFHLPVQPGLAKGDRNRDVAGDQRRRPPSEKGGTLRDRQAHLRGVQPVVQPDAQHPGGRANRRYFGDLGM